MKTTTPIVKIRLAKESDCERFRIWWEAHGKREFEKWQVRNQYNRAPVDYSKTAISKRMSG